MFQLVQSDYEEKNGLVANCDRLNGMKHSSTYPYAFTKQGVAMLSAVLRSKTAVKVSIQIMQAFVEIRKFISSHAGLFQRLEKVEEKQAETEQQFEHIFSALENKTLIPSQWFAFSKINKWLCFVRGSGIFTFLLSKSQ